MMFKNVCKIVVLMLCAVLIYSNSNSNSNSQEKSSWKIRQVAIQTRWAKDVTPDNVLARWYYHADKIGMVVWQDMVTCAGHSPDAGEQFERENKENIAQLYNCPCIVIWVMFNEGWARYDPQRLKEWMKKTDPFRVINGHTGGNYDRGFLQNAMDKWASTDLTDTRDYPGPDIARSLPGKARVLGESGGVGVVTAKHQWNGAEGWGYIKITPAGFAQKYEFMLKQLKVYEEEGLSGSIYTQPVDVETEENGMMSYDGEVIKVPAEKLHQIHTPLVPAASSYAWAGFIAQTADTVSPALKYILLLEEYKQGKRDSAFMHNLSRIALKRKDIPNAEKVNREILELMKAPYSYSDLKFIQEISSNFSDVGVQYIIKNEKAIESVEDEGPKTVDIARNIIRSLIRPRIFDKDSTYDFNVLEKEIVQQYGGIGESAFWQDVALLHYLSKDYDTWYEYKVKIHSKYPGATSIFDMNNDAWLIFENISDRIKLETALSWSNEVIHKEPTANYYDTYANLLYKLGRRDDAIKMQEKGITLSSGNGSIDDAKRNLDKMRKGEPTWK